MIMIAGVEFTNIPLTLFVLPVQSRSLHIQPVPLSLLPHSSQRRLNGIGTGTSEVLAWCFKARVQTRCDKIGCA